MVVSEGELPVIGIDLGTTYSACAYMDSDGKVELIPNREGERITPSVVLFDGGIPIVGKMAKSSSIDNPENTCQLVKRQMGERSYRFEVMEENRGYVPEEISAIILKRIKEDAEFYLNTPIHNAVITVPAYFNDAQRKATQDAGLLAGFNVLRIINEPTAAALAYGLNKSDENQTILVYDLGGGTFDITLLRLGNRELKVLATDGDKNLGGFNWDNKLMEIINEKVKSQGGPDIFLADDPSLVQDLRGKAEMAKHAFTLRDEARVMVSTGSKPLNVTVTRAEFEAGTSNLIRRTGDLIDAVLEAAQITWREVDKILLVGGSTRMRMVSAFIETESGIRPSNDVHPDEAVAIGAAVQGRLLAYLARNQAPEGVENISGQQMDDDGQISQPPELILPGTERSIKISDVTSHSLGVLVVDGPDPNGPIVNMIILHKNQPIPCEAVDTICTLFDNQHYLLLEVTQGEETDPRYVIKIGESKSDPLPPYPKGAPLNVKFTYDADGLIRVYLHDQQTGKLVCKMEIQRQSNRTKDELVEMQGRMSRISPS